MMRAVVEEDRITLHELQGVSLRVDFFYGSEKETAELPTQVQYSTFWDAVDVRVDLITFTECLSDLDFFFSGHQLFIDDQLISGTVIDFYYNVIDSKTVKAFCKIVIGWD